MVEQKRVELLPFSQYKTPEERVAAVRQAMADGKSNKSAAKLFGVKPGVIAGIRWRNSIPSTHQAMFTSEERKMRIARDEEKQRPPVPLKLAATEVTQCIEPIRGTHRCGYERLPGSQYCALHHSDKRKGAA